MALIQEIRNGQVVGNDTGSIKEAKKAADEDTFLTLLVAEMGNQDPLEPSDSKDWIAQYAQFTQVETINNMSSSLDMMRANTLVGKEVYVKSADNKAGENGYIKGKVDYVVYQGGSVKLSINEKLYKLEDLDTVVDETYNDAFELAESFTNSVNKLPAANLTTIANAEEINKLKETYSNMTDYQKGFISDDTKNRLAASILALTAISGSKDENAAEVDVKEGEATETT